MTVSMSFSSTSCRAGLAFGLAIYLFNWDRQNRTQRGHPTLALLALLPYVLGMLLALI